ncbi:hypothetical protein PVT68_09230 [Microbulbifer bruguierae]|uniref:Uncharacterized protein n=1 Tax=Microbulbifer bruguierae TaxID=3029061 RepID=A0ABY8NHQ9_9GAMM|nr:hypothetical protein [Microbulbifer bruguierae]WGL18464.1 hypothetical protein PVT68_09230 [Microbulbifer bruguierae]
MLKFRSITLYGVMLIALLVFQSVSACYDSHRELEVTFQHLPPHHQDAADGTPHLDQPKHSNHETLHLDGVAQLEQVTPGEHHKPDVVQDCNHCCHCHSSSTLCLPATNQIAHNRTASRWVAAVDAGFIHGYFSTPFRPPIA